MVSPLNPLVGANTRQQPIDLMGALAGGIQNRQAIQQNEQSLALGGQRMQMNDQSMAIQQQNADRQVSRDDYEMGIQRLKIINNIAKRVRQMPEDARAGFVSSLDKSMLSSVGIDPAQAMSVPLDDKSLDGLIAQTSVASGEDASSRSAENLPGGLTKVVMSDGSIQVKDAAGRVLEGDAAVEAVRAAEERGVSNQRDIYAARASGTYDTLIEKKPELEDLTTRAKKEAENATEQSKEYFKAVSAIDNNINNYREGIRLVREEGADTGVLASRLPSMKTAAIKLDNLRNRLGLDVVAGTTFGALSEAELKMAMDTAMPTTLQPEEMARWFEERIAAQEKYKAILDGAIQFLAVPGNTLADLRAMQTQGASSQQTTNQQQAPKVLNWSDM